MKQLEFIAKSPISDAKLISYLSCIDYTVSKKEFKLVKDEKSNLLITSPRPFAEDLMGFYESENYISHTDTKKTLLDKVYQSVRKYTLKSKVRKIKNVKSKISSILDIGCGTGDFLATCAKNNWQVFGVEPNDKARAISIQKTNSKAIYNSILTLENKNPKQKFDIITLWHVLEHVPNLEDYITSLKKLLQPDGVLIVAVPNFMSFDAQYYKSFWAAYDVPRHLWHFSPKAIKMLFLKVDMIVVKTWPMIFDAFYISLLSEKNKTKKGNFFRAFFIGLYSNTKAIFTRSYSSITYIIQNK